MSEAVFILKNITYTDWGEFLCVAKNSAGEDKRSVILKGNRICKLKTASNSCPSNKIFCFLLVRYIG